MGAYRGVLNGISRSANSSTRVRFWRLLAVPTGRFIATGNQDSTVHLWITETGKDLHMSGYSTKVRELSWHANSRFLATGGGPAVVVWDFSGKGPAVVNPSPPRA